MPEIRKATIQEKRECMLRILGGLRCYEPTFTCRNIPIFFWSCKCNEKLHGVCYDHKSTYFIQFTIED